MFESLLNGQRNNLRGVVVPYKEIGECTILLIATLFDAGAPQSLSSTKKGRWEAQFRVARHVTAQNISL